MTEVRLSPLHGYGVFATSFIPKGAIWWRASRDQVLLINETQWRTLAASSLNERLRDFIDFVRMYGYFSARLESVIICMDNARYVNHSPLPNSGAPDHGDPLCSIALKDIFPGDEITEDYSGYDVCPWLNDLSWSGFADLEAAQALRSVG